MNEVSRMVKNRLSAFIEYKGLTNASFEKKCGLSNGYIRNFKGNLGVKKLEDILASFPELRKEWLLFGTGNMLKDDTAPDYMPDIEPRLEAEHIPQLSNTEILLRDMLTEERARNEALNEIIWELKEENGKLKALLNSERKGGFAADAGFSSAVDAV